jgi:hypothetical protein
MYNSVTGRSVRYDPIPHWASGQQIEVDHICIFPTPVPPMWYFYRLSLSVNLFKEETMR